MKWKFGNGCPGFTSLIWRESQAQFPIIRIVHLDVQGKKKDFYNYSIIKTTYIIYTSDTQTYLRDVIIWEICERNKRRECRILCSTMS